MVALHHDPAVVLEAHEDGQRRIAVKDIGIVVRRHVVVRLGEGRNLHIDVDAKRLPDVNGRVWCLQLAGGHRGYPSIYNSAHYTQARKPVQGACVQGCAPV